MEQLNFTDSQKKALFEIFANLTSNMSPAHDGRRIKSKNGKFGKIQFRKFMTDLGITSPRQGLTETISFGGREFFEWLLDSEYEMNDIANVDEIRICFGVYTNDFLDEDGFEDENIGRLTIFLWPYKDGKPATYQDQGTKKEIPAFNLGGLKP